MDARENDAQIMLTIPVTTGYITGVFLQEYVTRYTHRFYLLFQILNMLIPDVISGYCMLKYLQALKRGASYSDRLMPFSIYLFGVFWIVGIMTELVREIYKVL